MHINTLKWFNDLWRCPSSLREFRRVVYLDSSLSCRGLCFLHLPSCSPQFAQGRPKCPGLRGTWSCRLGFLFLQLWRSTLSYAIFCSPARCFPSLRSVSRVGQRKTIFSCEFGSCQNWLKIFCLSFSSMWHLNLEPTAGSAWTLQRRAEDHVPSPAEVLLSTLNGFLLDVCFGWGRIPWSLPGDLFPRLVGSLSSWATFISPLSNVIFVDFGDAGEHVLLQGLIRIIIVDNGETGEKVFDIIVDCGETG